VRVFVLAGGSGDRWGTGGPERDRLVSLGLPEYRHWLPVGGEPIIERTIRMLRERNTDDIIVVAPETFAPYLFGGGSEHKITEGEPGPLLHGIATLGMDWGFERTVFLLGDVVLSPAMMDTVLGNLDKCKFIGRLGGNPITGKEAPELFGFTVGRWGYEEVNSFCHWMTRRGANINYPLKLWALYRLMCGLEHDDYDVDNKLLLEIDNDYSDDIDSVQEYQNYGSRLIRAALEGGQVAPAGPR